VNLFLKTFLLVFVFLLAGNNSGNAQIIRKSLVEFYASDSLLISADHYFSSKENSYILLFHREGSSRGEFESIADRFVKMGYNCLAVDMRNGDSFGFVNNKTASRAKSQNLQSDAKAEMDILAAIDYISQIYTGEMILLGSSFSATLCLKVATENENVKAVMTFSPGDFMRSRTTLKELLEKIQKPVFIASNQIEYPFVVEATSEINDDKITLVKPPENAENRGIGLLSDNNPVSDTYWLSVLVFIKSLQN
jgi:dienelactone hydrolase